MGLFNPQIADQAAVVVDMMDFDRKDEVMKKISENGTMYQKLQQMGQLVMQLAAMVTDFSQRPDLLAAVQEMVGDATGMGMTGVNVDPSNQISTNSLGNVINQDNSTAGKARERTATATEVK